MELVGEQRINASRERVWAAINDPDMLARCIPGCEEVNVLSPTERNARVMLKMGPVRARFSGRILMSDIVEPSGCRLNFEGSGGAAGFAKGESAVSLIEDGDQTLLRYTVSASVGGKLGQIGGRLIDASARKVADEFFTAFDAALTSDGQSGESDGAPDAPGVVTPAGGKTPSGSSTRSAATASPATSHVATPSSRSWGAGLAGELSRAFWFCLGVGTTLLVTALAHQS